ncbi:hypothetical protein CsSME_00025352 [Camellia sinensis var. sinensis]
MPFFWLCRTIIVVGSQPFDILFIFFVYFFIFVLFCFVLLYFSFLFILYSKKYCRLDKLLRALLLISWDGTLYTGARLSEQIGIRALGLTFLSSGDKWNGTLLWY